MGVDSWWDRLLELRSTADVQVMQATLGSYYDILLQASLGELDCSTDAVVSEVIYIYTAERLRVYLYVRLLILDRTHQINNIRVTSLKKL